MQNNSHFLQSLAISRFIAALIVVISHFMQFGLLPRNDLFLSKFHGGGIAVTYFFVLSGFVLAHNYSKKIDKFDFSAYYISRVSRIFPLLIISVAICGLTAIALGEVENPHQIAFIPESQPAWLIASLSQISGMSAWLPFSAIQAVLNAPSWSVGCEICFYFLFPFLLKLVFGSYPIKTLLICVTFNLAFIVALFYFTWNEESNRASLLLDRFPLFHIFEFTFGIVTCRLAQTYPLIAKKKFLFPVVFLVYLIVIFFLDTRYSFLVLTPIYSLFIYILSMKARKDSKHFILRTLVLLGNSSYSLYLLHWVIGIALLNFSENLLVKFICIPITILISVLSFRFFENPAKFRMTSTLERFRVR